MSLDRKNQQQTLSIRISNTFREFLERVRLQFSEAGNSSLSLSDTAKMLLESASENRLDDRVEAGELLIEPTRALVRIRQKWQQQQPLTRAEWIVVGQYVENGCERISPELEWPSRELYAQVLEAFLAVRGLRRHASLEKDGYYLENLTGSAEPLGGGRHKGDPELVPLLVQRTIEELRAGQGRGGSPFWARNLYVALREERIEGIERLNEVLRPYVGSLYRLAARGHWLAEGRPVREGRTSWEPLESLPEDVPSVEEEPFRVTTLVDDESEVHMLVSMQAHRLAYPLGPYPRILEFAAMLRKVAPGKTWNGRYFLGHTDPPRGERPEGGYTYLFREYGKGVLIEFSEEEWGVLGKVFGQALGQPEMRGVLGELALQYGEGGEDGAAHRKKG